MRMLKKLEENILLLMKACKKGSYEKIEEGFLFKFGEEDNCITVVTEEALEFKIHTIKWVPGNYEPIEGIETYSRIGCEELDNLTEEEKVIKISSLIDKMQKF